MTASSQVDFLQQPAFIGLSAEGKTALESAAKNVEFNVGQSLSIAGTIPNRVLLIKEGIARLLGSRAGRINSLALLGEGSIVGIASILRAEGCEEIAASTTIRAIAIPDTTILKLWENEKSFRDWCSKTLFPAELAYILEIIAQETKTKPYETKKILPKCIPHAKIISTKNVSESINNYDIFVCSANSESRIGEKYNEDNPPVPKGPFPLRLIGLSKKLTKELKEGELPINSESSLNENTQYKSNALAEDALAEIQPTSIDLGKETLKDRVTLVSGEGPLEESLACFKMMAKAIRLPYRKDAIEKTIRAALMRGQQPSLPMLGQLAADMGLHVVASKVPTKNCTRLNAPFLMTWDGTFAVGVESNDKGILLAHPRLGWVNATQEMVAKAYPETFDILFLDRNSTTPEAKFDLSWFLPALKRYKSTLLQVLLASFVVQLFTLANPLLIQVIIDKVISQRSLDTLQVLGFGLVAVTILEGVLGSLRTFLFADTTNRIDMRLGAEVIDHLLRLPVGYFDRRPVGDVGTRVAELEKIRNFLTSQALTTILDAAYSVIYIVVMAMYSWILTLVALIVVPIQVALTILGAPLFRRQFRQAAEENASTQAHLVEVLTGIQTVKAQNVEIVSRWKWQERYSRYISRTFEKTITATALNQTGQVLQKLSQLMVLWVGATLVLRGELTLGQLIAFRIISGYVTQPLLRLSNIWQNIQELKVSFERLADVIDTPEESSEADKQNIPLPPITGEIKFDDIQFRFAQGTRKILTNINIKIPAGEFVGVVGQSGSGKSTLMKLIPRLYEPEQGKICIDNYDISKVELYSLRRQIGIVPQDPLLFSGTISENIALTNPEATSDEIVKAATIACAHEFIMSLPQGYSTKLGERGASLSGGQKQRLAIARTLLGNPRLLVMDEATSALDYDTERRVCQNLRDSLQGCTVFFVTHRLSTVRNADNILMMHQGSIVETGSHDELIKRQGRYFTLYRQQEAS